MVRGIQAAGALKIVHEAIDGQPPKHANQKATLWLGLGDCCDEIAYGASAKDALRIGKLRVASWIGRGHTSGSYAYASRHQFARHIYKGGALHCGRCSTCVERREAFHLAGIPDPTAYEYPEFWQQAIASEEGV